MPRLFALAPATVLPASLPEIISIAAEAGYDAVGLPLNAAGREGQAAFAPLDPAILADIERRLAGEGVALFDAVGCALRVGTAPAAYQPFLETAARLGAKGVMLTAWDPDEGRLADAFADLCDRARPLGLKVSVEFLPWSPLATLDAAVRVVDRAGAANGGVMLDCLHLFRSGGSIEALAPHVDRIHYAQICDGPRQGPGGPEDLMAEARQHRMSPGDGELPLRQVFDLLPQDLPVSVEGPMQSPLPGLTRARAGLDGARRVLS